MRVDSICALLVLSTLVVLSNYQLKQVFFNVCDICVVFYVKGVVGRGGVPGDRGTNGLAVSNK